MRPSVRSARAALLALIVVAGGCGLFDTREPIAPEPGTTACRSLTDVDAAVANIEEFYGRVDGLTCYKDLIDTSFVFHPDQLDSTEAPPGTFVGWDDAVEKGSADKLALGTESVDARFDREYQTEQSPDIRTKIRYYDYSVRVRLSSGSPLLLYTGQAEMTFRRADDGQWRLGDWADHRGAVNDSTWGRLRRDFR